MSGVNIAWLDDQVLALYAQAGPADPAIWAQRYDRSCPSDFYRGYATILLRVRNDFHSNPNVGALRRQIDAYDQAPELICIAGCFGRNRAAGL